MICYNLQLVHAWVRLALFIHSLIVVAQMNTALAEWVCEAALLQQYTLGTCWNLYLMLFGLFFLFPETALKSTTWGFSTGTAKVVLQHKGPQSPIEQAAKAWELLFAWLSVHQRVASVTIHQPWQGHCLYKLYIPWCTSHHILQQFLLVWQWVSTYFLDLFACHGWILSTPTLSVVFWLSVSCRIVDPTVFVVFRVIDCFAMSQEHTEHPGYECRHAMKFISSFSVDDIANQADVPSQVHPEQGESYPRESCHRGSLGASWQPSAQSESKMWSHA